jgi:hypothetical protein
MKNAMTESELSINPIVSPELLPAPNTERQENKEEKEGKQALMCKIDVELTSYTTLQEVEVVVGVSKPLVASKDVLYLPNLCKEN